MEWTNRDVLKRIVALLFALAELADRASLASRPVRDYVLGILRPAEAVAQGFVFDTACDLGVTMPPQASLGGDHPDDATRLAVALRILALVLASLSARTERSASRDHVVMIATIDVLRSQLAGCRSQSVPAPDTS